MCNESVSGYTLFVCVDMRVNIAVFIDSSVRNAERLKLFYKQFAEIKLLFGARNAVHVIF